ncbi:Oidioi.mRNA.OKI2018_I69.XSR.g14529.t2.cds [Oikopleura dioica]|uniref:Oidioi.mRNA.OKI2018_I69.XSR.g14529.t2.cds n=1 Tax=Oikopleura dioica TaxID=34765 RepID=A0ABN7SA56_OIKDI|nr:Oidioi.mRNA.OKI2018_I69.XSR.g14529.t2.cds [Oikopleura dioica]
MSCGRDNCTACKSEMNVQKILRSSKHRTNSESFWLFCILFTCLLGQQFSRHWRRRKSCKNATLREKVCLTKSTC